MANDKSSKKTIEDRLQASRARKRRQRLIMMLVMGNLVVVAIVVGIAMTRPSEPAAPAAEVEPGPESATDAEPATDIVQAETPEKLKESPVEPPEANVDLVADDGRTLWVSPTAGKPIDLSYLPMGCQFVLHLRPAELLASEEGQRAWQALGPAGEQAQQELEQLLGQSLSQVEWLLVGARPTSQGEPAERVLVAKLMIDQLPAQPARQVKAPQGQLLQRGSDLYWVPNDAEPDDAETVVVASEPLMEEVFELAGEPPLLGRELELLASQTDQTRHMTMLLSPGYLFTRSKPLLQGVGKPLAAPLTQRLPKALKGAAVSMHLGNDLYLETRVATTGRARLPQVAKGLGKLLRGLPDELQLAVLDVDPDKYGRRVVANLPAMVRLLVAKSRLGIEDRQIIANAYLPLEATHNVLLASELMLAQLAGSGGQTQPTGTQTAGDKPRSITERLKMPVSVSFDRDTLEMALKYLSEEMQTPIEIRGQDLQLDGITKNQSFGLDTNNQPASEVLATILRLANPDKSATSLADEKQKLVYQIDTQPPKIVITTRSAAKKRKESLPEVFRTK